MAKCKKKCLRYNVVKYWIIRKNQIPPILLSYPHLYIFFDKQILTNRFNHENSVNWTVIAAEIRTNSNTAAVRNPIESIKYNHRPIGNYINEVHKAISPRRETIFCIRDGRDNCRISFVLTFLYYRTAFPFSPPCFTFDTELMKIRASS